MPTTTHPISRPASLRFVVDISAVTLNLSNTPDLAWLAGEPWSLPGLQIQQALSLRTKTHTDSVAWDSVVWYGMANVPGEKGSPS